MIAPWMLYAMAVALPLGIAALALERFAAIVGRPSRWIWLGALTLALCLPPVVALRPPALSAVSAPAQVGGAAAPTASAARVPISRAPRFDVARLDSPLVAAWTLASLGLFGLLVRTALAQRGARRSWPRAVVDGAPVLVAPDTGPAVVGLWRLEIVLPAWALAQSDAARWMILRHEEEHLRARDPNVLLLAAVALVLMPWNAALWWMVRRLRFAIETDCDRRLLRAGADPHAYGTLLLDVGGRYARAPALAGIGFSEPPSLLELRIDAMTAPMPRRPFTRAAVFAGLTGLLIAAACEVPRPDPVSPFGTQGDRVFSPLADVSGDSLYSTAQMRNAIGRYFPEVLRGERGGQPLWFAVEADGRVVATARGPTREETRAGRTVRGYGPQFVSQRMPQINPGRIRATQIASHPAGRFGPAAIETFLIWLRADSDTGTGLVISERSGDPDLDRFVRMRELLRREVAARYAELRSLPAESTVAVWFVLSADGDVLQSGRDPLPGNSAYSGPRPRGGESGGMFSLRPGEVTPARVIVAWQQMKR